MSVVSEGASPPPDATARSPDSTGQILLVVYEIYRVGDSARSLMNFARKGIFKCAYSKVILTGIFFLQISQIRSLYVGNH
jgi:hypothetical protein